MYPIKMHRVCIVPSRRSSHHSSQHGAGFGAGSGAGGGRGAGVLAVVLGLMLGLGVCGCHKATTPPPAAAGDNSLPVAAADSSSGAPLPPPGPQAAPLTVNDHSPQDIHNMERALVGWVIRNHQRPKSFEAFVAASGIQVPPPPAGKKYVIAKSMHIVLVDQ